MHPPPNSTGAEPTDEFLNADADNKRSVVAFSHSKELLYAVLVGVLVTIISAVVMDAFYYVDNGHPEDRPVVQSPVGLNDTQASQRLFYIRGKLAQVLSAITPARMYITEYYMSMGRFPTSSEDLDISALDLEEHPLIIRSYLSDTGAIGVHVAPDFGEDKRLLLQPEASTHGAFITWRCVTNIEAKYLGVGTAQACEHQDDL